MVTPCIINVPVTISHLQSSNLRRKGLRVPTGPFGLVFAWPAALGYSTSSVAPAASASGQTDQVMHRESAVWGIERGNASDDEEERKLLEMVDYNVATANLFYALAVIRSYRLFQNDRELSEEETFLAYVLGWCSQWLETKVFMIDDILDNSYTRRGQPCWFRLPEVGMIATNDASLLQTRICRILKKHFSDKPYYVQLLDLFNEIDYEASYGEMLDATVSLEKDLSKYTKDVSLRILTYKSYSFLRLPIACALILAGERLCDSFKDRDILLEITAYFQMENDYMDCFGDPAVTGKIGTDIEAGNCNWLIVKALEHANEEQKKIIFENYGKADPTCVATVKEVYASLNLQNTVKQCQKRKLEDLKKSVEMHPSKVVRVYGKLLLAVGR